jgi:CBS domain-containing protein
MELTRIAKRPAVSIHSRATVQEVCQCLKNEGVGAVAVIDEGRLVGIVSERDIVVRVVAPGLDPRTTVASEIMTAQVRTVTEDITTRQALGLMHEGRFRHLPLLDRAGKVIGMLSVRDLLRDRIDELDSENTGLMSFIQADGPGG